MDWLVPQDKMISNYNIINYTIPSRKIRYCLSTKSWYKPSLPHIYCLHQIIFLAIHSLLKEGQVLFSLCQVFIGIIFCIYDSHCQLDHPHTPNITAALPSEHIFKENLRNLRYHWITPNSLLQLPNISPKVKPDPQTGSHSPDSSMFVKDIWIKFKLCQTSQKLLVSPPHALTKCSCVGPSSNLKSTNSTQLVKPASNICHPCHHL